MPTQIGYYDKLKSVAGKILTFLHTLTLDGVDGKTVTVNDDCSIGGNAVNPTLPAFQANPSSAQLDIAAGGFVTVVFGTEVFDQGSNFASNTFTAPVTGKYLLSVSLYLTNIDTASSDITLAIVTTNRSYYNVFDPSKFSADLPYATMQMVILADMDASETAYVQIRQTGGANQMDISTSSFFCGYLVC